MFVSNYYWSYSVDKTEASPPGWCSHSFQNFHENLFIPLYLDRTRLTIDLVRLTETHSVPFTFVPPGAITAMSLMLRQAVVRFLCIVVDNESPANTLEPPPPPDLKKCTE